MSWSIYISGHKDFPAATRKVDTERMEALVLAEVEALLPQLESRLKGHGLTTVTVHGTAGSHPLIPKPA